MRIPCPNCGDRNAQEFRYRGDAVGVNRPAPDASIEDWDNFVHLRENPAGITKELWFHEFGCAAWIVVTRNTVTHEVIDAAPASKGAKG